MSPSVGDGPALLLLAAYPVMPLCMLSISRLWAASTLREKYPLIPGWNGCLIKQHRRRPSAHSPFDWCLRTPCGLSIFFLEQHALFMSGKPWARRKRWTARQRNWWSIPNMFFFASSHTRITD